MRNLKGTLSRLELAALVLAALIALAFQARLPTRLVAESSYRAVAAKLSDDARPGDVVLLFPWWTERARLFLPAGLPVVGYLGSDSDALAAFPRIWVIAQPHLPRADSRAFGDSFSPDRSLLWGPQRHGNLELALYQNGRHRQAVFSAVSSIASAKVFLDQPGGARTPCSYDGTAHRCPGAGNVYVAPEWHAIPFAPHHCLWFHPPGGDARLVAEFPQVPRGERILLEGGLVWDRGSFVGPGFSDTHLGVDDLRTHRPLLEVTVRPGEEGLRQTESPPPGGETSLALKLWSQADKAELRDLCVELKALGDAPREGR